MSLSPTALLIASAKENFLPALVLQVIALSVVLCFFFVPQTQFLFESIAALKTQYGSLYAIVSTSVFGGLLPFLFLYFKNKIDGYALLHLLFYLITWAFMGWLIDSFYQLQAHWFGNEADVMTVVKKTLVDQFIFSVVVTAPMLTALYIWKENNFNLMQTRIVIKQSYLRVRLPATVISTWSVWLPAVILIYTMPSDLQTPLFNLVLCFFVLIITALDKD